MLLAEVVVVDDEDDDDEDDDEEDDEDEPFALGTLDGSNEEEGDEVERILPLVMPLNAAAAAAADAGFPLTEALRAARAVPR